MNTYSLPRLAISAPATSGPTMREAFIEMPFSASAAGNCARGTKSGTMAANTGQRSARPMPLAKVSASSKAGLITFIKIAAHNNSATPVTQICVNSKKRLRFKISASAPLGKPKRNTGKVEAVCTSATQMGMVVIELIIHAAATSFIHMQTLAVSQVNQSMRNTGTCRGARAEGVAGEGEGEGSKASDGYVTEYQRIYISKCSPALSPPSVT